MEDVRVERRRHQHLDLGLTARTPHRGIETYAGTTVRVSVVIPVLDDADELRGCLECLAAQSRPADEIVVVDNGSLDDSAAVARGAGVRVVDEPVRGIPSAAASGYDAARGDVIARLDADSRPGPDWVAAIARAFDADPALAALTGPGDFLGVTGWRALAARALYMEAYFVAAGAAMAHVPPAPVADYAQENRDWLRRFDETIRGR